LHDGDRGAGEAPDDQPARVTFDSGAREVRDLGIGDRDGVLETIREAPEAGTEDNRDLWLERCALADEGSGAFGLVKCGFGLDPRARRQAG
jgi:hypothetical protein